MRLLLIFFLVTVSGSFARDCSKLKKSSSKLFCYYSKLTGDDDCYCTHIVLPSNSDVKTVEKARQIFKNSQILVTVNQFNLELVNLLKNTKLDGLEINPRKLSSKNDITDFISTVRSKLGSNLYLAVSVPPKSEILAKYYDFKSLSKHADAFLLQTSFLGASTNVTFHPSRLSGIWDMQNTDSIVDFVIGLGAPVSKLVITAPVQAFEFTLQNEEYSAVGSPAVEMKSITRDQLCQEMKKGTNWTLERDQDQSGPYIFSGKKWIAFEDNTSIDIKAKFARIRGLAGMAFKDVSQDGGLNCGVPLLEAAYNGLSRQSRAPRQVILQSLEREILETPHSASNNIHVSPFRISRIIDVEGKWHVVREDTRTEFTCTRQGYFTHPRSCNRFYRCVKFDQLVDEYNVFEFDCPAGLAFDERVEVCVWPGSLPEGQPCAGSSEIAPVPKEKFTCPHEPGYYADPENCRWFFACIDHGQSTLTAYEFRCPFGLVFDSDKLMCEWYWMVPKCASGNIYNLNTEYYTDYSRSEYHQPINALQAYDGLGPLGVIKLGGVAGEIQKPIINSNILIPLNKGEQIASQAKVFPNNGFDAKVYGSGSGNIHLIQHTNGDKIDDYSETIGQGFQFNRINDGRSQITSNGNVNIETGHIQIPSNVDFESAYIQSNTRGSDSHLNGDKSIDINSGAQQNAYQVNVATGYTTTDFQKGLNGDKGIDINSGAQQNAYQVNVATGYTNTDFRKGLNGDKSIDINSGAQQNAYQVNVATGYTSSDFQKDLNGDKGIDINSGAQQNAYQVNVATGYTSTDFQKGEGIFRSINNGPRPYGSSIQYNTQNGEGANVGEIQNTYGANLNAQYNLGYVRDTGTVSKIAIDGNVNIVENTDGRINSDISSTKVVQQPLGFIAGAPTYSIVSSVPSKPISSITTNQEFQNYQGSGINNIPGSHVEIPVQSNSSGFLDSIRFETYNSAPAVIPDNNPVGITEKQTSLFAVNADAPIPQREANSFIYHSQQNMKTGNLLISQPSATVIDDSEKVIGNEYESYNVYSNTPSPKISTDQSILSPAIAQSINSNSYFYSTTSNPRTTFERNGPTVQLGRAKPILNYVSKEPPAIIQGSQVYVTSTEGSLVNAVFTDSVSKGSLSEAYQYSQPRVKLIQEPQQQIQNEITSKYGIKQFDNTNLPFEGFQQQIIPKENVYIGSPANSATVTSIATKPEVTQYNYQNSIKSIKPLKAIVSPQLNVVSTTIEPITYFSNTNVNSEGYSYPKPEIPYIEEAKVPVQETTFVKKTSYITGKNNNEPLTYSYFTNKNVNSEGYFYPKPETPFEEESKVPTLETSLVKDTSYITEQNNNNFKVRERNGYINVVSSTPSPQVPDQDYGNFYINVVSSTPSPQVPDENYQGLAYYENNGFVNGGTVTYSTLAPQYNLSGSSIKTNLKNTVNPQQFYFYDSRLTTPKPQLSQGYTYSKPTLQFEETPVISTTSISSTENYIPEVREYNNKPFKFSVSSFKNQFAAKPIIVSTPAPFTSSFSTVESVKPIVVESYYAPELIRNNDQYQQQNLHAYTNTATSTPKPSLESTISSNKPRLSTTTQVPFYYYDSRYTEQSSGSGRNIYSPAAVSTTFRTTKPYFSTITPIIKSTVSSTEINIRTASREPVKAQRKSRVRFTTTIEPLSTVYSSTAYVPVKTPSTISVPVEVTTPSRDYLPVKINVKNARVGTLKAGKSIIKQNNFLPLLSSKLGAQCTCTSSNLNVRRKQKIIDVDIDEDDAQYVVDNSESTGNIEYEPQKTIVEITPNPITTLEEKNHLNNVAQAAGEYEEDKPSDREIIKAIKTGLKLVKQAAKDGAREGTEEAIQNNNFRVQDKIECQRAGLFRHPNHCNKFYSCKWDCYKNKYVVHSFNCPIQLTFDHNLGACNWPSQGPACAADTLLPFQ